MRFYPLMLAALCVVVAGQQGRAQDTLPVNSKAPPFTLRDQSGQLRSLADLLKGGNVALVFHRSASW